MTLILKIGKGRGDLKKVSRAAEIIKRGGIVVFPTETVYGIGANALNPAACKKIYLIKGRARDNPMIVHVSSMKMANRVAIIPKKYYGTMAKLWPAPLTIVVKARKTLPKVVTAGLDTVAIRMPDNEVALRLISESGVPIAAPSANISKRPSSTRASHAKAYFLGKVDAIIDAGSSEFGLESTVLDLRRFVLLRPGAFTVARIENAFKRDVDVTRESRGLGKAASRPISPGTKYRHYSPKKPLFLFTGDISDLPAITSSFRGKFTFIGSSESCRALKEAAESTISLGSAKKPREIASNLFDALIALDSEKSGFAIIEEFSEAGIGLAIMNRVRKACAHKYFSEKKGLQRILKGMKTW